MEEAGSGRVLRTSRLLLRPPDDRDLQAVLRLHQDGRALLHNPSDALHDEDEARRLLQQWQSHWRRYATGYFALSWHEDPAVVGFCGTKVLSLHGRSVSNLFYRLDPQVWGRGVAGEAATAVVHDVLLPHPDRPVVARVRAANVASARVALRSGLLRRPDLDTHGEDGLDEVYVAPAWPAD